MNFNINKIYLPSSISFIIIIWLSTIAFKQVFSIRWRNLSWCSFNHKLINKVLALYGIQRYENTCNLKCYSEKYFNEIRNMNVRFRMIIVIWYTKWDNVMVHTHHYKYYTYILYRSKVVFNYSCSDRLRVQSIIPIHHTGIVRAG